MPETTSNSLLEHEINTHAYLCWRPNPEEIIINNENFMTNNDEYNNINWDLSVRSTRNTSFVLQDLWTHVVLIICNRRKI